MLPLPQTPPAPKWSAAQLLHQQRVCRRLQQRQPASEQQPAAVPPPLAGLSPLPQQLVQQPWQAAAASEQQQQLAPWCLCQLQLPGALRRWPAVPAPCGCSPWRQLQLGPARSAVLWTTSGGAVVPMLACHPCRGRRTSQSDRGGTSRAAVALASVLCLDVPCCGPPGLAWRG